MKQRPWLIDVEKTSGKTSEIQTQTHTHTYSKITCQNNIIIIFFFPFSFGKYSCDPHLWMDGMWEHFQGSCWKVRTVRPRSTEHKYITFSLWGETVGARSLCSSLSKFISAWKMNLYKVTLQSGFPQHSHLNVNWESYQPEPMCASLK